MMGCRSKVFLFLSRVEFTTLLRTLCCMERVGEFYCCEGCRSESGEDLILFGCEIKAV